MNSNRFTRIAAHLALLAAALGFASQASAQAQFTWSALAQPPYMINLNYNQYTVEEKYRALASNGLRVVLGGSHGTLAFTDDGGSTWTAAIADQALRNAHVWDIAYAGGTWVAVTGVTGQRVLPPTKPLTVMALRSTDGANWTVNYNVLGGDTQNTLLAVAGDGLGRWIAGSYFGRIITSVDDGRTWTTTTPAPVTVPVAGVAYFNGLWYMAYRNDATQGTTVQSSSDGGATWATVQELTFTPDAMKVMNGRLFVTGDRNGIASTANGTSWTLHQRSNDESHISVGSMVYTNSKGYSFFGEAGQIRHALKTLTGWTQAPAPTQSFVQDATNFPGDQRVIIVSGSRGIFVGRPR